jgi:hypothetical protein
MIKCLIEHNTLIFLRRERNVAKQVLIKIKQWNLGCYRDIAHYMACCDTCSRVNIEHQKPPSSLKPLEIPVWK